MRGHLIDRPSPCLAFGENYPSGGLSPPLRIEPPAPFSGGKPNPLLEAPAIPLFLTLLHQGLTARAAAGVPRDRDLSVCREEHEHERPHPRCFLPESTQRFRKGLNPALPGSKKMSDEER